MAIALKEYYSAPDLREFIFNRLGMDSIPDTIIMAPAISYPSKTMITAKSIEQLIASEDVLVYNFTHPRGQTEEVLARFWKRILEREMVGAEDVFMDLGGNSLSAVLLLGLIEEEFKIALSLDRFLEAKSIRTLAALIDEMRGDLVGWTVNSSRVRVLGARGCHIQGVWCPWV
ncbi:MAG: hypothetical protein JO345_38330 [Streptosporangiaceae bacterium]|nr:hypothetical protein [Streptosporangiaceae bacterium]